MHFDKTIVGAFNIELWTQFAGTGLDASSILEAIDTMLAAAGLLPLRRLLCGAMLHEEGLKCRFTFRTICIDDEQ